MKGYRFDEYGDIVESDVYLVWGSPASGKTTYVKQHMKHGDMVIDLDLIKQSLGMCDTKDTSDCLLSAALKIQELLYKLIEDREFEASNVWIVASMPDGHKRNRLIRRLDIKECNVIFISATEQQCIERAINDDERKDKDLQQRIISRWFKVFYGE